MILLFDLVFSDFAFCRQQSNDITNPYAVTTFECAGIYWKTVGSGLCKVRYKEIKSTTWRDNLELVYDPKDGEYRGSIINLTPDKDYEIELTTGSAKTNLKIKTRNDKFPIGKTTILSAGESDKAILITESGTPEAYHLVSVPANSKSVLNLKNISENGIEIDADYVIVRGIEVRNAAIHGIRIRKNHHDIVIEQCHITFWGRIGGPKTYGNLEGGYDSGVYAEEGTSNLTIQRNLIDDPRGASNDWETGHPDGPPGTRRPCACTPARSSGALARRASTRSAAPRSARPPLSRTGRAEQRTRRSSVVAAVSRRLGRRATRPHALPAAP